MNTPDPELPAKYLEFMRTGWGERELVLAEHPITNWAAQRREKLRSLFPEHRLVIPAGNFKVRANDTDYRFRSDTAHTWLCGNQTSDAVLVITPEITTLYARPRSSRSSDEFFRDRSYGELWAGRRPSLTELADSLQIETANLPELATELAKPQPTLVLRGRDASVDKLIPADPMDADLASKLGELRLIKDEWEISELETACAATALGFTDCLHDWNQALQYGERWIEGTFFRRARAMGNDLGYDSIVGSGSHATTLHWIENSGQLRPGEMVLLDMGVEGHNLYTADISRTLPINGKYTPLQRELYSLVLAAQTAGIAAVRPGADFLQPHRDAMAVLADGLVDLGILKIPAAEALAEDNKTYSRWTLHGTSHMLGMDVHDCAATPAEIYPKGKLEAGMVLTVEPGLYFQADDLLVPEELRGIGIRIEDDILVTATGAKNLSAELPRDPDEIEAWMDTHWQR